MVKVLVADDSSNIRELVKAILAGSGYEVVEAANGESAYSTTLSEKPDLILLDIMMPVVDGFEVLRKLRANPATKAMPVVLLTALSPSSGEHKGMSLGVTHYLTKPFDSAMVKAAVTVALREAAAAPDTVAEGRAVDLVRTGIIPLDKLLGDGIPVASLTLIEGASSAGKSVLCHHFTHESLQGGHGVAYFTSENDAAGLTAKMNSIGLDVSERLKAEKLRIQPLDEVVAGSNAGDQLDLLAQEIDKLPSQHDVIIVDPVTNLVSHSQDSAILGFFSFCKRMSSSGKTMLLVADSYAFTAGMFPRLRSLCDANLKLKLEEVGGSVVKMLEVSKIRNAERTGQNTISFEVEPWVGMRIIPVRRVRA